MELRYRDGSVAAGLPDWATYLYRWGHRIGCIAPDHAQHLLLALTLPTRGFGAALVSLGAVAARLSVPEQVNRLRRFKELSELPSGSLVTCYWHKRRRGTVTGLDARSGFLVIEFASGDRVKLGPGSEKIDGIFASDGLDEAAVHPVESTPLLTDVIGGELPVDGANRSRLDCVIVGTRTELEAEIGEAEFLAPQEGSLVPGHLQEVLRVRSLLRQDETYRADIVPASSQGASLDFRQRKPRVVVFDGAKPFLRFQKQFAKSHCAVILDRTESAFADAVQQVRVEWARRRDGATLSNGELVPDGVEVLEFWRN